MSIYSGILPVLTTNSEIADCNIGEEVSLFGLVFINSTGDARTLSMTLFRQVTNTEVSLTFPIAGNGRLTWEKTIALQPGDYVTVMADAAGVNCLWSVDRDIGVNPVATGFTAKGVWSNSVPYQPNDLVSKSGSSYCAIAANTGKDPEVETAFWLKMLDGAAVNGAIDALVGGAPTALNTLGKIAVALNNDANFYTTLTGLLALKAPLATPSFSGIATFGGEVRLSGSSELNWGLTATDPALVSASGGLELVNGNNSGYLGIRVLQAKLGNGSVVKDSADGTIVLSNAAGNDFGMLRFGGATNAYPALKRSGTMLSARLANDAGDTVISALHFTTTDGNYYFGGNTAAFPRLKRNGAALDVRLGDDSAYADINVGTITSNGSSLVSAAQAIAFAVAL